MQITRGKQETAQKCVLYGPEGIGKTTFASKFPEPLFIDTEGSTKHLDVARTPKPSSWQMLLSQVEYVKQNPTICKTLAIDTADWAEQLCITHVCAQHQKTGIEDFGYGKGYIYLVEEFGRLLNRLEEIIELGINVVVTAHAQMRKFEQPDELGAYDRWELKLQKKTSPLLKEWADMVLFANYKTNVINVDNQGAQKGKNKAQGGKRVMFTTHHPCWDAKNRHNLPEELPLDFENIRHCIPVAKNSNQEPAATVQDKITYWYHPESDCVFELQPGEKPGSGIDAGSCVELSKEDYIELKAKLEAAEKKTKLEAEKQTTKEIEDQGFKEIKPEPEQMTLTPTPNKQSLALPDYIPKPLADLMIANDVTEIEVQEVVGKKGYYTPDTKIDKYDPNFINGVLIGAWGQVFEMIQADRTPF